MALSLIGLDAAAKRRYTWIGDDACDVAASDYARWNETGEGLVAKEGQALTVIVCEALRPTTVQGIWSMYHSQGKPAVLPEQAMPDLSALKSAAFPALLREFVAYGVVAIENGPQVKRECGIRGMRLSDETLGVLEKQPVVHVSATGEYHSLISHLGSLLLHDNSLSDQEKKV